MPGHILQRRPHLPDRQVLVRLGFAVERAVVRRIGDLSGMPGEVDHGHVAFVHARVGNPLQVGKRGGDGGLVFVLRRAGAHLPVEDKRQNARGILIARVGFRFEADAVEAVYRSWTFDRS